MRTSVLATLVALTLTSCGVGGGVSAESLRQDFVDQCGRGEPPERREVFEAGCRCAIDRLLLEHEPDELRAIVESHARDEVPYPADVERIIDECSKFAAGG